jgi:hypothetical protein
VARSNQGETGSEADAGRRWTSVDWIDEPVKSHHRKVTGT